MKQVYEWCDKRGLRTTGHILYENDLGYQTRVCGAAMPQLRYLHNPGIDLLGAQTDEYLTVKQCASVAHQYERSMTISEAYGCTGWELDFFYSEMAGRLAVRAWNYETLSASCPVFHYWLQEEGLSAGFQLSEYLVG